MGRKYQELSFQVTALVFLQWQLKTQAKEVETLGLIQYVRTSTQVWARSPYWINPSQNTTANSGPNTEKSTYLKALEGNQKQYWRGINT